MAYGVSTVYDNGGRTFDRYAVKIEDEDGGDAYWIFSGHTGNVPNGVFMSASADEVVEGEHLGSEVNLETLPERVQISLSVELRLANTPA